ncbi:glutamate--cysteine ligase [Thermopolyspora sp. NPDC052614]|uniref:carboxylate-amine ligase n=1 Tax=Thermopolyspora sp. NPDC052614 TaxID=3155682 RepID=UPI0034490252
MHDTCGHGPLTVGVEEEFLLVDRTTGRAVPAASKVMRRIKSPIAKRVVPELTQFQIETNSDVHTDLRELARDLTELRTAVADAADAAGVGLIACGNAPLNPLGAMPPLTAAPRYRTMCRHYRALLHGQGVCGCHVHIGIPDREQAIRVSNHARPWLPLLQALTANSPIAEGADTGYASWRAILWSRWPSAGPPPPFHSAAHYDALVDALITSGVILDRGMVYWLIRPSHHLPTLEFRTADTCATVLETVLLAALVRALAATALAKVRAGLPAPALEQTLLQAACWRAARDGLEGDALDPATGRLMPAWTLLTRLTDHLRPALHAYGDLETVTTALTRLRRDGSAAARQRAAFHRRGRLSDVISLLLRQTRADPALVRHRPTLTRHP